MQAAVAAEVRGAERACGGAGGSGGAREREGALTQDVATLERQRTALADAATAAGAQLAEVQGMVAEVTGQVAARTEELAGVEQAFAARLADLPQGGAASEAAAESGGSRRVTTEVPGARLIVTMPEAGAVTQ